MQLPAPTASKREAILKHEIQKRSLNCSDDILSDVASKCDGYDAYDLVCCLYPAVTDFFFIVKVNFICEI